MLILVSRKTQSEMEKLLYNTLLDLQNSSYPTQRHSIKFCKMDPFPIIAPLHLTTVLSLTNHIRALTVVTDGHKTESWNNKIPITPLRTLYSASIFLQEPDLRTPQSLG